MFRVENNVPDVYINESRDFQLFSRLYDLVFQSSRFSIDSMEQLSDTMYCNDAVLPLIATKVGFFTDLRLTSKADRQILSAFPHIMKFKGSLQGIQLVANLFERIVNTNVYLEYDSEDKNKILICFEDYAPNISLLTALLDYIRPTGLLIDFRVLHDFDSPSDYIVSSDKFRIRQMHDTKENVSQLSYIHQVSSNKTSDNSDVESNVGFTQILEVEETRNNAK